MFTSVIIKMGKTLERIALHTGKLLSSSFRIIDTKVIMNVFTNTELYSGDTISCCWTATEFVRVILSLKKNGKHFR